MTFEQIMQLVNAGYTKADIDAMTEAPPASATGSAAGVSHDLPLTPADPAPVPEAQPQMAQPAQQAQTPAQPEQTNVNQPEQPEPDRFRQLEDKLNLLLGITHAGNLNANIGGSAQPSRSATDILGSVIAPPRKDTVK